MKLAIMMAIYLATVALGLAILYGPLKTAIDPDKKRSGTVAFIVAVPGLLFLFPMIGALVPDGPLCWFFQKWGNIFIGYLIYFFGTLLLVRMVEFIIRLVRRIKTKEPAAVKRRTYAVMLSSVLALSLVLNVGGWFNSHNVRTTFYEVPREVLGQDEPLRIVLIGDLHIGVNSTPQLYKDMVDRINEQDPDIVVVAGDIVTSSFGSMRDPDAYASIMSNINAKAGKYVVYGNHDVEELLLGGFTFIGAENAQRHPDMEKFLSDCGWILLTDETVRIPELNDLVIAGRRDESRPGDGVKVRASLPDLLRGIDPDDPVLLIQHEPSDLEELDRAGVDMSVSGHTHDGQIFPGNVFSRIKGPQSYGLKQWGSAQVIVTSGVGFYGPPIRVGTISEIVVIDCK